METKVLLYFLVVTVLYVCFQTMIPNVFVDGKKTRNELNEPCQLVVECRTNAYFCGQNRTCQCAKNYIPNRYSTKCLGAVGEKCRYDDHCVEGAYCFENKICKCKEEEFPIPSADGFACTDAATQKLPYVFLTVFSSAILLLR